jgi:heptosyltransferase I
MRVLLVKMSSLGDVVHALPAVTDAADALRDRGLVFDWVVEEAFADIPARHPAIAEVLPIAWRRWRGSRRGDRHGNWRELGDFVRRLRRRRYDLVLDAQGLLKSAAVTALARADVRAGLARTAAREGAAALFYGRTIAVPRGRHAIDRLRQLFALALVYPLPEGRPRFGLAAAGPSQAKPTAPAERHERPRCVLLHGSTWPSKLWPIRFWCAIAERAAAAGFDVVVPWGDAEEHARARDIAAQTGARVLDRLPLAAMMDELAGAALVVGVDSGLAHLAGALDVPTVVIYGSTSAALTGARGRRVRNLQAEFRCAPCFERLCGYDGRPQHWQGEVAVPACYATVPPERVWQAARELVDADRLLHL